MKIKNKLLSISITLIISVLLFSFTEGNTSKVTHTKSGVIYFVRHAEKVKGGDDPVLTEKGALKAQELAEYLKESNIKGVYATDFLRTINTGKPLADKLGVEVELYDKKNTKSLMEALLKRGGNHLVICHWGTANDAFGYFNVTPEYDTEKVNNNTDILKVTYSDAKLVEVVLLRY